MLNKWYKWCICRAKKLQTVFYLTFFVLNTKKSPLPHFLEQNFLDNIFSDTGIYSWQIFPIPLTLGDEKIE